MPIQDPVWWNNALKFGTFRIISLGMADRQGVIEAASEWPIKVSSSVHFQVFEPVFVARPGAADEDDGVIVSPLLTTRDIKKVGKKIISTHETFWCNCFFSQVQLLVLDATTFTEIGRVTHDANGPVTPTLHGIFDPRKLWFKYLITVKVLPKYRKYSEWRRSKGIFCFIWLSYTSKKTIIPCFQSSKIIHSSFPIFPQKMKKAKLIHSNSAKVFLFLYRGQSQVFNFLHNCAMATRIEIKANEALARAELFTSTMT